MQAFHKAPLLWSGFLVADLLCIIGFLRSRVLAQRFMERCNKKKGWLSRYSLFMASWGTGQILGITWNYRISFAVTAVCLTFVLIAAH